jgi:hypothetical protein
MVLTAGLQQGRPPRGVVHGRHRRVWHLPQSGESGVGRVGRLAFPALLAKGSMSSVPATVSAPGDLGLRLHVAGLHARARFSGNHGTHT